MTISRLTSSQKIRIVSGPMHLQTTVGKVRTGLGDSCKFNAATQKAVDALEYTRNGKGAAELCANGISGQWEGIPVQIDLIA